MSWLDDVSKVAKYIEPIAGFVALAQHATGLGGAHAEEALAMIRAGLGVLDHAAGGADTPAEILAKLEACKTRLVADRAAEDADLAARFPSEVAP